MCLAITGLAAGAETDIADIIALNVRTEINFGLFSDGCTALSWQKGESSYLAQNWDVRLSNKLGSMSFTRGTLSFGSRH